MVTATKINEWRIVPRILVLSYGVFAISTGVWFWDLVNPNASQAAFASTIWAAGPAWFGFYVNSGKK